jgi:ACS family hexuronate transporter-like MFS transporter
MSAMSILLPFVENNFAAMAILCLIVCGNNWVAATYIGTVGDIFHESVVGRVNGIAGAGDSGMGMITMLLTGIVVDRYSYSPVLIAAAVLPMLSLLSVFVVMRRIEPVQLPGAGAPLPAVKV